MSGTTSSRGEDPVDDPVELGGVVAVEAGGDLGDQPGPVEHLPAGQELALGVHQLGGQPVDLGVGQRPGQAAALVAGAVERGGEALDGPAVGFELADPAGHELVDAGAPLDRPVAAGGDVAGPVARVARLRRGTRRSRRSAWRTSRTPRRGCRRCASPGPARPPLVESRSRSPSSMALAAECRRPTMVAASTRSRSSAESRRLAAAPACRASRTRWRPARGRAACGSPAREVPCRVTAYTSPDVGVATAARPRRPPRSCTQPSSQPMVPAVSASRMACMSSARPTTPSSDSDLWAATTSSNPGRCVRTSCSPVSGSRNPPGPNAAGTPPASPRPSGRGGRRRRRPTAAASRPASRSSRGPGRDGRPPGRGRSPRGRRPRRRPSPGTTPRRRAPFPTRRVEITFEFPGGYRRGIGRRMGTRDLCRSACRRTCSSVAVVSGRVAVVGTVGGRAAGTKVGSYLGTGRPNFLATG